MQTTSLTIEWHNWGLYCGDDIVLEKATISKPSGTIHITQSNGRREIILDEYIKAPSNELQDLFTLIDQVLDTDGWAPDYSVDVCDGFMWNMYIRRGTSTMMKVHGTVEPPPTAQKSKVTYVRCSGRQKPSLILSYSAPAGGYLYAQCCPGSL